MRTYRFTYELHHGNDIHPMEADVDAENITAAMSVFRMAVKTRVPRPSSVVVVGIGHETLTVPVSIVVL